MRGEPVQGDTLQALAATDRLLGGDHEVQALLRALDGRFIAGARRRPAAHAERPAHRAQPARLRSVPPPQRVRDEDGALQAARLLARHEADGHGFPESIALVLWGTDNLKNEGAPIAQALALIGAEPRFDGYGRLAGAELHAARLSWAARASTW